VHHARAVRYWDEEAAPEVLFCRVTAMGYLRLVTNPSATKSSESVSDGWRAYRELLQQPGVRFIEEPAGVDQELERWATEGAFGFRHWTDAHLAAIAVAADLRLVSFDRDFNRFDSLSLLLLRP
jgi:toxin-antitoxin system PIN domain toxin